MAATLLGKPDSVIVEQAVNIGTFDTLATARELESAGLERGHAEAIANAMRKAVGADRGDLATKADVGVLRTDLDTVRSDVDAMRIDIGVLRTDLDTVRSDVDAMRIDIGVLRTDLDAVRSDVGVLRTDLDAVRSDVGVLRTDLDAVRSDVGVLRTDLDAVRTDLAVVRSEFGHFVTRGEFYRGLWIQGAGIIAVLTALRFLPI